MPNQTNAKTKAALATTAILAFALGALVPLLTSFRSSETEAQAKVAYRYEMEKPIQISPRRWSDQTVADYPDKHRLTRIANRGGEILNPNIAGGHIRTGHAGADMVLIRYRR